jgi:hypothetical protein
MPDMTEPAGLPRHCLPAGVDVERFSEAMATRGWLVVDRFVDEALVERMRADLDCAYVACRRLQVANGIALDTDKAQLAKYHGQKPIPWPQLHEAGGLDGRLAEELGVLTLPTMFLLDAEGKVVDRNLVIADLEKKLEEMVGQ